MKNWNLGIWECSPTWVYFAINQIISKIMSKDSKKCSNTINSISEKISQSVLGILLISRKGILSHYLTILLYKIWPHVNCKYSSMTILQIQLNPAITDSKGLSILICYIWKGFVYDLYRKISVYKISVYKK